MRASDGSMESRSQVSEVSHGLGRSPHRPGRPRTGSRGRHDPGLLRALTDIAQRGLFDRGDRVLVAVSGGADSMALLHALHEWGKPLGLRLAVGHVNHGLRGAESDGDAAFVRRAASALDVPVSVARVEVRRLARRRGISIEMAAREARYAALVRLARRAGAGKIATAHTADDAAETMVLRFARGASRRGLTGIPWRSLAGDIPVVRPLLGVRRGAVIRFLERRGVAWREDPSNRDPAFLRNRVRHEVLPLLEARLNPALRAGLSRMADVLQAEDEWLDRHARDALAACGARQLDAAALSRLHPAIRRRVIAAWLLAGGLPPERVDFDAVERVARLAAKTAGHAETRLGGGWIALRQYAALTLARGGVPRAAPAHAFRIVLRVPGVTVSRRAALRVRAEVRPGIVRPPRSRVGDLPATASLRHDVATEGPLVLRSWRPGDRIAPLGMKGSRKLHDLLVDAKVPAAERNRVPVLECGGEIAWVAGYRAARSWAVADPRAPALQLHVERLTPRITARPRP